MPVVTFYKDHRGDVSLGKREDKDPGQRGGMCRQVPRLTRRSSDQYHIEMASASEIQPSESLFAEEDLERFNSSPTFAVLHLSPGLRPSHKVDLSRYRFSGLFHIN